MASSSRLKSLNPQKLWLVMIISGILLLILSTAGGVFLGLKQNQTLVQNENKMMLRRNGELLLHQNIRTFVESLGFDERDYRLSIGSELDHQKVTFGKLDRTNLVQCSTELYFQYEVELCRPPPISWPTISIIFAIFSAIIAVVAIVVRRLGLEIVESFQDLFRVAKIQSPQQMNFNEAWLTAFSMAQKFSDSQVQLLVAEKNRAIVDLSRQVAHDIRSPLTALNFLAASLEEVSEEKRDLAKRAIKRIDEIASELLQKSNVSALNRTNLKTLIQEVLHEKKIEFQNMIQFEFVSESDEMWSDLSPSDIARIISNLLNNSAEASARNILVKLRNVDGRTEITISDNGSGMTSEQIAKVGLHNFSTKVNGHGLGLTHAKNIINSVDGQFQIVSESLKGTSVKLILPQ